MSQTTKITTATTSMTTNLKGDWTSFSQQPAYPAQGHLGARQASPLRVPVFLAMENSDVRSAWKSVSLEDEDARARLVRADAYQLPFAGGSFDCCFFGFWLSHVPQALLATFFGEVQRV